MNILRGRRALVTGASGGLGSHIAKRLATEGMDVAISGRREDALAAVASRLRGSGVAVAAIPADLADLASVGALAADAEAALGPIDLLVNNAGVEAIAAFPTYTENELRSMIDVNLAAPMLLAHALVPGMLARGRGHVVFVSSLAGKLGPAYNEPYAATKAGLIGLTQSLRAEYRESPVGFSVVCPGFIVGDGQYQRWLDRGMRAKRWMGETSIDRVLDKLVAAIRDDRGEVIESGTPVRAMLALCQLAPGTMESVADRMGITDLFRRFAAAQGRAC
jgi:short-subunit dehydrogenase